MDIIEMTRELGKAIQADDRYIAYCLAKQANEGHLAGFYDVDGIKMYVTRGTRYWGPPMRILAPSEITVFNFVPEEHNAE